jgi:hypothetical protein
MHPLLRRHGQYRGRTIKRSIHHFPKKAAIVEEVKNGRQGLKELNLQLSALEAGALPD